MTHAAPISPDYASSAGAAPSGGSEAGLPRLWALIPCAGRGTRAASALPKQYQRIAGKALVLHTLAAFTAVPRVTRTLVVVAVGDDFFAGLGVSTRHGWASVARGGATRAETVGNGLAALKELGAADGDWVLVHDAARCLVTPALIDRLIDACEGDAVGGLLAQPVSDTLKRATGDRVSETRDRAQHWLAQTPQMFRIGILRQALRDAGAQVTDEASAIEAMGLMPKLVNSSVINFKVTYPEDFALAQAVLLGRDLQPSKDLDYDYP